MYENAKIESFRADQDGTELLVKISDRYIGEYFYTKRIRSCELHFDDGRHITVEQRKKAYATIRDIAVFTGYLPEELKEWMKYQHIMRTGCDYFSLSNCSIDTAKEFINTLLEVAVENGIPLSDNLTNRTDDIGKAMYYCLKHRKCSICGNKGEIHHVDTIGMGGDRRKVDDSDYRKICLCRTHHTEAHAIEMNTFENRYKVYGIIYREEDKIE